MLWVNKFTFKSKIDSNIQSILLNRSYQVMHWIFLYIYLYKNYSNPSKFWVKKTIYSISISPKIIYVCIKPWHRLQDHCRKKCWTWTLSWTCRGRMEEPFLALSSYMWHLKSVSSETPNLKWSVLRYVPPYSNISNKCLLCLYEKLEIATYQNQTELLNKRSELLCKCHHANKFLLENYTANYFR